MREKPETVESNWDGIATRWRAHFVTKLQDLYGLPEEEARTKADTWLGWLKQQTEPNPPILTGARNCHRGAPQNRLPAPEFSPPPSP